MRYNIGMPTVCVVEVKEISDPLQLKPAEREDIVIAWFWAHPTEPQPPAFSEQGTEAIEPDRRATSRFRQMCEKGYQRSHRFITWGNRPGIRLNIPRDLYPQLFAPSQKLYVLERGASFLHEPKHFVVQAFKPGLDRCHAPGFERPAGRTGGSPSPRRTARDRARCRASAGTAWKCGGRPGCCPRC